MFRESFQGCMLTTLGQKSTFYPKIHMFKIPYFKKFTFSKSHISKNSRFQNHIFHKNHMFRITYFKKFTFSKSHFSQKWHYRCQFFTKIAFSKSHFSQKSHYFKYEFMDKMCDFAPVCLLSLLLIYWTVTNQTLFSQFGLNNLM